jgi:hypothetical protein
MATWRWSRALTLVLPVALAAACMASPEGTGGPAAPQPTGQPPAEEPEDPWAERLEEAAAEDCAALARRALAGGLPSPSLALRPVGDSAAIDNDLRLGVGAAAPCLVMVAAPEALAPGPRRIVGREAVRARHADGTRPAPNPEFRELKRLLAAAERGDDGEGLDVRRTGDPAMDLVGSVIELLARGAGALWQEQEVAALRERLEATPATLEEPRSRAYSYQRVEIEAVRHGATRAALADARRGSLREARSRSEERRRFQLAEGRRADDLGPAPPQDLAALDRWERQPPPVRVSTLLAHLLELEGERPGDVESLLAGWSSGVAPAAGPGAQPVDRAEPPRGIVAVMGAGGAGAGFVVAAGRVLTLERLVAGSDVARVAGGPEREAFALVERRDRQRGLALLRVPGMQAALELTGASAGEDAAAIYLDGERVRSLTGRLVEDAASGRLYWQGEGTPPAGAPILARDGVAAIAIESGALGTLALPADEIRAFWPPVVAQR